MRKLSMVTLAFLSTLLLCGSVLAVPWVWTDNIDENQYLSATPTPSVLSIPAYHYVHQLYGFDPGKDFLSTYNVEIALRDDDATDGSERAYINLPGVLADGYYDFSLVNNSFGISVLGWIQLQRSGELDVSIIAKKGDFVFDYSHLTAYGCESEPYSVAEPSAMMVLGIGLFGLAGCARKRFKV